MKTTRSTLAKTTLALLVTAGLLGSASTNAATSTWSGAGNTTNFSTAGNWDAAAVTANSLVFGSANGTQGTILNNDLSSATLAGITFNAGALGFTINGNSFTLGGNIVNNSTATQTIGTAMVLNAGRTFTTTANGGNLVMNGVISGAQVLTLGSGGGVTYLNGANTFSGGITATTAGTTLVGGNASAFGTGAIAMATSAQFTTVAMATDITDNFGNNLTGATSTGGTIRLVSDRATKGTGVTHTLGNFYSSGSSVEIVTQMGQAVTDGNAAVGLGTVSIGSAGGASQVNLNSLSAGLKIGTLMGYATNTAAITTTLTLEGSATNSSVGSIQNVTNGANVNTAAVIKTGPGIWSITGGSTYTGTTTVQGGTLILDYSTNNTAKLSTGVLTLSGGTIQLNGGNGTAVENVASTTLSGGQNQILQTGSTPNKFALKALTVSSGLLNIGGTGVATTSTANDASGALTNRIVIGGTDLAANDGSGNIVAYTGYSTTGYNSTTVNYLINGGTNMGSLNAKSLKITSSTGTAQTMTLTNSSALGAGGGTLLYTGSDNYTISMLGASKFGNAALIIEQSGTGNLTMSSIGNSIEKYGSGTLIINGTAQNTATWSINAGALMVASNLAINSTGNGSAITLNGGTFIGDTTVGSFALDNAGANPHPFTVGLNGGGIDVKGGNTLTVSGVISSTAQGKYYAPLNVGSSASSGTIVLTGANTFAGGVNLNGGVIQAGVAETAGTSGPFGNYKTGAAGADQGNTLDFITFNGGTLQYSAANQYDYSSRFNQYANQQFKIDTASQNVTFATGLFGAGSSLTKLGTGTLSLNGNGGYTGPTTVSAGTLKLGAVNAISSGTLTVAGAGATLDIGGNNPVISGLRDGGVSTGVITNSGSASSLVVSNSDNSSFSGTLTGSTLGLTKNGSGTLTLSASNGFSGGTVVNAGQLTVSGTNTSSAASVNGGTLQVTGQVGGVTVNSGGTLAGNGSAGAVTLNTGSTITSSGASASAGSTLTVSSLTVNGGTYLWNYQGASNDKISASGAIDFTSLTGNFYISVSTNATTSGWNAAQNTNFTIMTAGGNFTSFNATKFSISGPGTGAWTVNTNASSQNLTLSYAAPASTVALSATLGNTKLQSMDLNNFGGITGSNVPVLLTGAGEYVLDVANSYGGVTTIGSGTLTAQNANSFGTSGTIYLGTNGGGNATVNINTAGVSVVPAITVGGSGVNLIGNSSGGAVTYSGQVTLATNVTISSKVAGGNLTMGGALSGAGTVTVSGPGVVTLGASNNYAGGTTLNGTTLTLGNASALGTGSLTLASAGTLNATSSITVGNAVFLGANQLKVDATGNALGLSGVISGAGSVLVTNSTGSGVVKLSGNNTYSGGSTVAPSAVLSYGGSTALGTGTVSLQNGSTLRAGVAALTLSAPIQVDSASTASYDMNNLSGTYAGNLQGSGILAVNAGSGLTLSGSNAFTGTVRLTNGSITVSSTGDLRNSTFILGSAGPTLTAYGTLGNVTVNGNGYGTAYTGGAGSAGTVNATASNATILGAFNITGPAAGKIAYAAPNAVLNPSYLGTAIASNGSPVVTLTNTAGLKVGMVLNGGNNIAPTGTSIISIDSPTQITLSANATATTTNAALNIYDPATEGLPGTNYGYASFKGNVTAANLVVDGRLDIASGNHSLSGITGTSNSLQTNIVGGGSGVIVYSSTNSNNLGFVAGGAFSGLYLGATNTVASLTQSGTGTTYFGAFGSQPNNSATLVPSNSQITFNGGNWAIGQFGQANSSQMASGAFTLTNNANIVVGGNTNFGGPSATRGTYNISQGSLSFLSALAENAGGTPAMTTTLQINVGAAGVFNVQGNATFGNTAAGTVAANMTNSIAINGGTAVINGNLYLGAGNSSGTVNDVVQATVNSGSLTASNIVVGTESGSSSVTGQTVSLNLTGGKIVDSGSLRAGTNLGQANSFNWSGGQLSAGSINATNNWTAGTGISNNTLYNTNGVLAPGDLRVAGKTTISGNYTQTGNGTLALDFAGANAATSFTNGVGYSDQLAVSSNATIGGKVQVSITPTSYYGIGATAASNVALITASNLNLSGASILWDNGDAFATTKSNNGVTVTLSTNGTSLLANVNRNTWIGSGNWGSGGSAAWSMGIDPNGTNSFAYFGSNSTVNLDRSSTIYSLAFGGGGNNISSDNGSSLTLSPGVGSSVYVSSVSGSNSVSVPVTLNGDLVSVGSGTVTLASVNIGTNNLTVNSGTLNVTGISSYTGSTLVVGGALNLSQNVSGTNGVSVTGGSLNLAGSNNYTGGTVLSGGTLETTYNGSTTYTAKASGVTFIANMGVNTPAWVSGALTSIAAQMTNATLGVDASGTTVALTDAIANTNGGITVTAYGNGTTTLVSGTDYSGVSKWGANGGTLSLTNTNALVATNKLITLTGNGVLSLDGNSITSLANDVTVTAGGFTGSIANNTGLAVGLTGTLTKNNAILKLLKGSFNVSGNIVGTNANSDLYVSSGANVTLSGSNSFNGPTHVDTGSSLVLDSVNALPTNTALVLGSGSDLAGQVNTLNIGSYNATATSLTASGLSSNVVAGSGTLSLSGDLTASTGSTLDLGVAVSGVNNVNLNGGTLLLKTGSSINSTANVAMNGGSLNVGSASSSFSNLTLTGNSVINFAGLTAGTTITFSGIANLNGNSLSVYNWNSNDHLNFTQGSLTSGLSSADLVNISFYSDMGTTLAVPGNGGSAFNGNEIVPVPEPSVILAAILMVALMAFAKREEISRLARRVTVR